MDTGRKEKSSSVHFEMPTRERPADLSGRDHDVHGMRAMFGVATRGNTLSASHFMLSDLILS